MIHSTTTLKIFSELTVKNHVFVEILPIDLKHSPAIRFFKIFFFGLCSYQFSYYEKVLICFGNIH